MKEYKIKERQTTTDIALEVYGSVEGLFWLAEDNSSNNTLSWLFMVPFGQKEIRIREAVIDTRMRDYLSSYAPFGTYYY
jgi:hypothetical protein